MVKNSKNQQNPQNYFQTFQTYPKPSQIHFRTFSNLFALQKSKMHCEKRFFWHFCLFTDPIEILYQSLCKPLVKAVKRLPSNKKSKNRFFSFFTNFLKNLRRQKGVKNWSCSVAKTIFSYPYRLFAKSNFFTFSSPSEFLY